MWTVDTMDDVQDELQRARHAWDRGDRYLVVDYRISEASRQPDSQNVSGRLLEAIEAVGWQLHTWSANVDESSAWITPLFVRSA